MSPIADVDDWNDMPDCGGHPNSRVTISVPETEEPIRKIVFVSSMESYSIFCSIAWPSTQTVDWNGSPNQTANLLPDRIAEVRVVRENSVVRLQAPFDLSSGSLIILPDWPAMVANKKGVTVERSEILEGSPALDEFYFEQYGLDFTGTHERITFPVNSTMNKGIQVAVDVHAEAGNGYRVKIRLVAPAGDERLNVTLEDPDSLRREVEADENGTWTILIDSENRRPPASGTFDVKLLFRY